MPRRIKRSMIHHVFEYEYFVEKIGGVAIAAAMTAIIIVLAGWVDAYRYYSRFAASTSLRMLGLPLAVTLVILLAAWAAIMIPHFEPGLRPKRFRIMRDKRLLHIYLSLIAILLSISALIALLISVTGTYTYTPF